MGLFDFFKAKELQLIKEQGDRIQELEEEVKALSPYKSIVNIEADIESKLNKLDLDKLEYNSIITHKIPVFAIQFIESKKEVLDLICKDEDELRRLTFNYDGIIVEDSKSILSQKGE